MINNTSATSGGTEPAGKGGGVLPAGRNEPLSIRHGLGDNERCLDVWTSRRGGPRPRRLRESGPDGEKGLGSRLTQKQTTPTR